MTRLEVNRRELMRLGLSAGVTVVGGSMLLRARAAHAADGEVVAAVFPGSWEDCVPEHRGFRPEGAFGRSNSFSRPRSRPTSWAR